MSDEQPPPPSLRLKPRVRPPESNTPGDTPATTIPEPGAATIGDPPAASSAASDTAPKIRLKPRLASESAANSGILAPEPLPVLEIPAAPASAVEASAPKTTESSPAGDAVAATPEEAAAPRPQIRLKPRVADPAPSATIPPTIPPVAPAATIPTIPPTPAKAPEVIPPMATIPPAPVIPAILPAEAATDAGATPATESGKFKLKPKPPVSTPPPGPAPTVPPAVAPPPPAVIGGVSRPPVSAPGGKPPPFPVMAPPALTNVPPPIPHVEVKSDVPEQQPPPPPVPAAPPPKKRGLLIGIAAGVVVLLGAGGFLGWKMLSKSPPPPPVVAKPKPTPAPTAPATAKTSGPTPPVATAPATDANSIAHVPINAVKKAQGAVDAQRSKTDHAAETGADDGQPAKAPTTKSSSTPQRTTVSTALAPGVSATSEIDAATQASAAFRSFVASARIRGVVPPRALINDRIFRTGDVIDSGLGVRLEAIDQAKRQLIFKDTTGATVTRPF
jgi:hypothetical protein